MSKCFILLIEKVSYSKKTAMFFSLLLLFSISVSATHAADLPSALTAIQPIKKIGWCQRILLGVFPNKNATVFNSSPQTTAPQTEIGRLSPTEYDWLFRTHLEFHRDESGSRNSKREYVGQIEFSPVLGSKYFLPAFTKSGAALFFRVNSAEEAASIFAGLNLKKKSGYTLHTQTERTWFFGASFALKNSLPASDGSMIMEIGIDYSPNSLHEGSPMDKSHDLENSGRTQPQRKLLAKTLALLNSFHSVRFLNQGELSRRRNLGLELSEAQRMVPAIGYEKINSIDIYNETLSNFRRIRVPTSSPSDILDFPTWFGLASLAGSARYVAFQETRGTFDLAVRTRSVADATAVTNELTAFAKAQGLVVNVTTQSSAGLWFRQLPENDGGLYLTASIEYRKNKIDNLEGRHLIAAFIRGLTEIHKLELVHESILGDSAKAMRRQTEKRAELGLAQPEPENVTMLRTPFYGLREQFEDQTIFSDLAWSRYEENGRSGWVGKKSWPKYDLEIVFRDSGEVGVVVVGKTGLHSIPHRVAGS